MRGPSSCRRRSRRERRRPQDRGSAARGASALARWRRPAAPSWGPSLRGGWPLVARADASPLRRRRISLVDVRHRDAEAPHRAANRLAPDSLKSYRAESAQPERALVIGDVDVVESAHDRGSSTSIIGREGARVTRGMGSMGAGSTGRRRKRFTTADTVIASSTRANMSPIQRCLPTTKGM